MLQELVNKITSHDPRQLRTSHVMGPTPDPMNPLGLLVAYAERQLKPVVSDFDTFTVGSRGMSYEPTPPKQASSYGLYSYGLATACHTSLRLQSRQFLTNQYASKSYK